MSSRKPAYEEEPSLAKESADCVVLGESASRAGSAATSRSERAARRAALRIQTELAAQREKMELFSLEESRKRAAKADEARARMAAEERQLQEEEEEEALRQQHQQMQFQLQAEQSVLEAEELAIALVEEEDRDAQSRQGTDLEVGPEPT